MYKKMYNKVTVGGPESSLGTAAARTNRLPITGMVLVNQKANKAPSEVITGRGTTRASYIDSIELSMEIPMELHCDKGTGLLFVSNLGQDLAAPVQVGAAVRISYTGAQASCKIVVANTTEPAAKTITSSIGALGAESVDNAFGTTGVIDLTAAATDTAGELAAVINAYDDYTCEVLFGGAAADAKDPLAITYSQAAGNSVIVYFKSASSGVYLHRYTPVLANTERPTLTFQSDGTGLVEDILAGAVVDQLAFSADLKGRVAMTATVVGTAVTNDTASTVALSTKKPMKFSGASFYLAGTEQTFVKSLAATIANNHDDTEGFGAGSLYKQDHAKGVFGVSGTLSLRSTTTTEVEYAKRITESVSSLAFMFTGDDLKTNIPEMVLVKVPHIEIRDAKKNDGSVGIDTELTWEMIDPQSYDDVCTVDMLTTDSTKYN